MCVVTCWPVHSLIASLMVSSLAPSSAAVASAANSDAASMPEIRQPMCHFTMSSSPCLLSLDAGIPTCRQSSGLQGGLVHRFHGPAHDNFDAGLFVTTSFLRHRK